MVEYDAISLDQQGCPIGGSVHADHFFEAQRVPEATRISRVFGDVAFGPACGDAS